MALAGLLLKRSSVFVLPKLKAEAELLQNGLKLFHFQPYTSYSSFVHEQQKSAMSALSTVVSWDVYFKQNKDRLKEQYKKQYGANKDEKEIVPQLNSKVAMWKGDITKLDIDAIVNAANSSLLGGGGVDGAIHRAAGPDLLKECRALHGCNVGEAKITSGHKLPAKHVIHTVGPQGEKPDLLKSCYNSSLQILIKKHLRTVAFPCISTGIYGYPQEPAAHVALNTVRSFLEKNKDSVDQVIFCLFLPEDVKIYENLLQKYFPVA